MIMHFLKFADEAAAKAALPSFWSATDDGWDWDRARVDGPIPIVDSEENPVAGYFLNIALTDLDVAIPGLTGAGYGPADHFTLVFGDAPVTPQRVFA